MKDHQIYHRILKRMLDFFLACCAIVLLSLVYIIIAVLVRIKLGGPVLFCQERPGKDEKIFKLYKFRTMTDKRDEQGRLLPDEVRLTSFGKTLRSTSLDELPEFINIFKGDMSLVGPRPLLVQYLPRYNERQRRRHEVRPGLTGWAQVNGRNAISWEEKFEYDVEYVEQSGFLMDIKILFKTIGKVFARDGINGQDGNIMQEFLGSQSTENKEKGTKEDE